MFAHLAHVGVMKRANRPAPPIYLSKSPPVPEPEPLAEATPPNGEENKLDPTRYGDWEKKGIAIDF
jgi:hypothetical protein